MTTQQTRRLVESAVDTYDKSLEFYQPAAEQAAFLALREPEEDDTVVALVSDRHDNIGMDRVARAIADRAGATAVFDAGDDTSTGAEWEAFSLDSVNEAFDDLDRYGVAGNHDSGDFVASYLSDLGWTMLDGELVEGPGGIALLRRRRPAVQRPRQLARRDRAVVHRGRRATGRRRLRDPRAGRDAARPRRQPGPRGARARLHRPRRRRPPARPEGARSSSSDRTARSATATRRARPAGRRTPSRSAASPGARPTSRCSPIATAARSGIQGVTLQTDGVFVVGEFVELDYDTPVVPDSGG